MPALLSWHLSDLCQHVCWWSHYHNRRFIWCCIPIFSCCFVTVPPVLSMLCISNRPFSVGPRILQLQLSLTAPCEVKFFTVYRRINWGVARWWIASVQTKLSMAELRIKPSILPLFFPPATRLLSVLSLVVFLAGGRAASRGAVGNLRRCWHMQNGPLSFATPFLWKTRAPPYCLSTSVVLSPQILKSM